MSDAPRRLTAESAEIADVLGLIRREFSYMDGRIDPPSSMHRLTEQAVRAQARDAEIWVIGRPVVACVFLTPKTDQLYLGKLAVDARARGQGLAHRLVALAGDRARALGLPGIYLQSRVELTENHAAFERMGFAKVSEEMHAGYTRPTSYGFWKDTTMVD